MSDMTYPKAEQSQTVEDWFGTQLPDPYDYFRDPKDPRVSAWVAKENALTDAWFADKGVDACAERLKAAKLPEMYGQVAPWHGGYLASRGNDAGSSDFVLLDADFQETGAFEDLPQGERLEFFAVTPSPADERLVCCMGQYLGDPRPTIFVYDVEAHEVRYERAGSFSADWSRGDGRLYLSCTEADPQALESHTQFLAFDPKTGAEEPVFAVEDTNVIFGQVHASSDGAWVLLQVCQDYSNALWVAYDVKARSATALCDHPVEWYYVDTVADLHHFVTMSEAANGAVIGVGRDGSVSTVLAERDDLILNGDGGFSLRGEVYVTARADVSRRLVRVSDGSQVALPSDMGDLGMVGRTDGFVFLRFCSFVDAPQLLAFDGRSLEKVWAVSDATHPDVVVEQRFAPSTGDGTLVPYYLVRRRDAVADGSAPVLMYAYGGYNIDMPPWYQEMVTSIVIPEWVEAGGIYVHANLRGGNEYGPSWHEAGMLANKRHCYEDYIGVATQVIADGWTSAGRICPTGCSNGGLLSSALVTMRPDLWGAVIDSVPHTDMIHFADDDRGPMYVTEYGNPHESKEMYDYLLSYSPYHNVRQVAYPPIYIQTGECDNNVPPYHGKKLAARMQQLTTGEAPVLLRVLARGSHNRGGTPEEYWRTTAEMHSFIAWALGVTSC